MIGRYLISLTGADRDLLAQARETTKYKRMGGTVLTTGLLATISATFALHTALDAPLPLAVALGVAWGLAILNLDSWIVAASKRLDTWQANVGAALPRLLLAVVLGFVISEPLVLQVFSSEIDAELTVMRAEQQAEFDEKLTADPRYVRMERQKDEVEELEDALSAGAPAGAVVEDPDVQQAQREYDRLVGELRAAQARTACEGQGTCGSGQAGAGRVFDNNRETQRLLQAQTEQARAALEQAKAVALEDSAAETEARARATQGRIDDLREEIARADRAKRRQIAENAAEVAASDGLLAQMEALERISEDKPHLAIARWFLFGFLLVIECTPVLVKLITNLGPPSDYDELLRMHADAHRHRTTLDLWGAQLETQVAVEQADLARRAPLRVAQQEQDADLARRAQADAEILDTARLEAVVALETVRVQAETAAHELREADLHRGIELWSRHEQARLKADLAVKAAVAQAQAEHDTALEADAALREVKSAVHRTKLQQWRAAQEPVSAAEVQQLLAAGQQEARARAAEIALRQARTDEAAAQVARDAAFAQAEAVTRTAKLQAEEAQAKQVREEAARSAADAAREASVHAAARAESDRRRAEVEHDIAARARAAAEEATAAADAERAKAAVELATARSAERAALSAAAAAAAEQARLEAERAAAVVAKEIAELGAHTARAELVRAEAAGVAAEAARAAAQHAAAAAREEEKATQALQAAYEAEITAERAARQADEEATAAAAAAAARREAEDALARLHQRMPVDGTVDAPEPSV